ncbi:hypothetical protein I3760_08G170700 [Carya illinoinensis]|uniref:Strictosidine synthase conserved region domain-containing protein n=1 Tax=Carya illinoinensis TaxID=32201 RepID=A0A8T1PWT1_CARIL|nr:protein STRICTOSIDINE SYNTHASE-LIKE 5-like [Carya illinoinensis]KAG2694998.1 hypothetical protein I3760_08G170700 [Carya illinoinensis]KAG6646244.1 hypothetical protein CIPAW_08G180500 [Carya illinoinensis]
MSESKNPDSASTPNASRITSNSKTSCSWLFHPFLTVVLVPVVVATILYNLDSFDPAPLPPDLLTRHAIVAPAINKHMLRGAELVGVGNLEGPEDVAYDRSSGVIYTGCADGWISRVNVNDSEVQKWINIGGRPLGIAVDELKQEVVVADPKRGLLKVTAEGTVEVLTDEAEGQKFRTTDAVDVAQNGMVYFSDASYKYSSDELDWDILEGKPHGRLLSYDPATKATQVLLPNLYFANGVAVSPDQNYVIFCETTARRCRKYHISGNEKGKVDKFIENLPGMPDNIRYDGEGHYWIALAREHTLSWHLTFKYPLIRKFASIALKYTGRLYLGRSGGVLVVDLAGKPMAHYYDPELPLLTSAMKIGDHLYCGSLVAPYIISLNLKQYPAV